MSNPQRVGINTNVKQFNTSSINSALWLFTKSNNTITPGNKLANVLIQGNLTVTGTLNTPSDLTVKENIKIISEEESDKVLELQKIKFNYVYDNTKKQHYGLIAQEVEIFFPELVSGINYVNNENDTNDTNENDTNDTNENDTNDTNENDTNDTNENDTNDNEKMKTVNYLELIPIMLSKMSKMQEEINYLKLLQIKQNEIENKIKESNFFSIIRKMTTLEYKTNNLNNEILELKRNKK